jgi:transposase
MTPWSTREELVQRVVSLAREKVSRRAIAISLRVSRNTVRRILETHGVQRESEHSALPRPPSRTPRASKLDPYKERIGELLDKYPDITGQRIFELLTGEGFDGGFTTVKNYVRRVRPKPKRTPSLETPDYGPGKMAESDWSPYELTYTDGTKEKVQLFGYVLVHSKRKFYRGYRSYDTHMLMRGHVAAFERFEGAASNCKYDGQKAVVIRWEGQQPIYSPQFLAFAAHYEFRPIALRGNPNFRPNVERSFWTHERSFLVGREFRDLDDFNVQLAEWLANVVDVRKRHGTTSLDRFAEEAPHLVSLPRHPYDTARVAYRLCSIDGFIDWQGNRYAVPYDHITDLLPIRITDRELFVYAADLTCIASHELAPRGQGLKSDPKGFHRRSPHHPAIDLDQLRVTFEQMGEHSAEFFRQLSSGPSRHWGRVARRILLLRERFATEHVEAALGHATRFGALSHDAVLRILEAHHQPRTLDEYVSKQTAQRLESELGIRPTAPRDLTEYDRLSPSLVTVAPHPGGADAEHKETTACQPTPTATDAPEASSPEPPPTKSS